MSFARRLLSPLTAVYIIGFFFALHVAVPTYVTSSFLAKIVPEKAVGLLYAIASAISVIALFIIPRILKIVGDFRATLLFLTAEIAVFFGLAFMQSPLILAILFIVGYVLVYLISFDLDLIVERYSKDATTGSTRGLYLTFMNIAWVLSPVLAAGILTDGDYWRVFLAAAILLIPALVIFGRNLEHFKDPRYRVIPLFNTAKEVWRKKDLRNIFAAMFFLQFFYTWMVIYTPIYLHNYIGFLWKDIGIIFSIMLVPFLLLEAPLGRLADRVLGEKEMLSAGFVIMALSTALMSFVTSTSFLAWAGLLFMTRVGAAMVEIMIETYFFKKVDGKDANIVSMNRAVRPFAGIMGPLAATLLLSFVPFKFLFLILGVFTLLGLRFSTALRDTK